jgi:uncharacterized protein YkwD
MKTPPWFTLTALFSISALCSACVTPSARADDKTEPCAWPQGIESTASHRAYIVEVCRLANVERASVDAPPLALDARVLRVAQSHARDMAERRYFNHVSPEGEGMADRLRRADVPYRAAAENIAQGQRDPDEVVADWMDSRGHRVNLLNPSYRRLGVGLANYYWVQNFTD